MGKSLKIALNVVIVLIVAGFVRYMIRSVNREEVSPPRTEDRQEVPGTASCTLVSSFDLPQEVNRFELHDGKLFISAGDSVCVYDTGGNRMVSFPVKPDVRDITVEDETIYLLYPAFIEVYTADGKPAHRWEACSELSDYCSFALAGAFLFVTDAENKNICKYTKTGNFVKFINSPRDFIIPSYSFDIESRNDTVYCVNSGRHLIESYTLDGDFIAAFGGPGGESGFFAGCCNPVYISFTPDGELITSEKGNPRVGLFERNGLFKKNLLNSRLLGSGTKACEVGADGERLFVAGKNKITVYSYHNME
ncbi:MAG: hypothetical protein LBH77_04385 [Tannerella sp.]|jgi:hypothetical protein|nr:hypothetical protein [Tannerella sp.]